MSTPRSRFLGSLLGLGLLLSGVAAAESELPAITVRLQYQAYNLSLSEDAVTSQGIQLHRSATALRGRAFGTVADLALKEDGVSGVLGDTPVNLKVRKEGDTVLAEGGFMGGPVKLRFNAKQLQLYVNRCRYDLTYVDGGRYEGRRSTDRALAPPIQLTVPPALQQRAPAEQVALLLFALADPERM